MANREDASCESRENDVELSLFLKWKEKLWLQIITQSDGIEQQRGSVGSCNMQYTWRKHRYKSPEIGTYVIERK